MRIRLSRESDIARILEIYSRARAFMAANGNPRQWGATGWPPEDLVREDIALGRSRVCEDENGRIIAVFVYLFGEDIDDTYRVLEGGEWSRSGAYGVVHRIAADGPKGTGSFCIEWALRESGYLRIDTHGDNRVMLHLLPKLGFRECGVIHVAEDNDPRIAFDRVLSPYEP